MSLRSFFMKLMSHSQQKENDYLIHELGIIKMTLNDEILPMVNEINETMKAGGVIANKSKEYPYTVADVAKMFNRSPFTIQKWCRDGGITAIKIGNEWLISKNVAEEIQKQKQN